MLPGSTPHRSDHTPRRRPPHRRRNERGGSAAEYGLLLAGIAGLVVIAMFALGGPALGLFDNTCQAWAAADPNATGGCG